MEKYYIWLLQLFGETSPMLLEILENYESAEVAYNEIMRGDYELLKKEHVERLSYVSLDQAERVVEHCEKQGVSMIRLGSKEYPKLLSKIYYPPILLFAKGDLSCLDNLSITVVGARDVTPYISKLCKRVCKDLALRGVTIVSGMAVGVDYCAHSTCVQNNKPTVGVLACGIDYDYPKYSKSYREKIVMAGGAYMTELLPSTNVSKEYFKARNRILAGLSRGTAVFQASKTSGSLITARYAVDENRDLFCVPCPNIYDEQYLGVVEFLRDGAIPLFNHDDILMQYEGLYI